MLSVKSTLAHLDGIKPEKPDPRYQRKPGAKHPWKNFWNKKGKKK